jgi:FKBP-type peptidyl-prolyl cis-trans isomerase FkpA
MKKLLILSSLVVVLVSSCSKSDDPVGCTPSTPTTVAPNSEVTTLQAYVSSNYPTATQHPAGFFYEIFVTGTGTVTPVACSTITVKYTAYAIPSNVKVDEAVTPIDFTLGSGLYEGWQYGIPMIKAGGKLRLLLPPSLTNGDYLRFEIELIDVK